MLMCHTCRSRPSIMAHFDLIYPERFGRPQIASFSGSIGMALLSGELDCADDVQIDLIQVRLYKFITLIGNSEKISFIDWFTDFKSLSLLCTIGKFVLLIFLCSRRRYKKRGPTGKVPS